MAAKTTASESPAKRSLNVGPIAVVVVFALLAAGAGWWFFLRGGAAPAAGNPLTPEMKAYVRNLKLAEVELKATESYVKNTIVELTGKVTNAGDRVLKTVEINCIFYDAYGQVVLRERLPIVRSKMGGPLPPGQTRAFRLPFDNLPGSWNQGLPQMVIAFIAFEN